MKDKTGCLYAVGVGPGDPQLMTLKAVRILGEVNMVAYFAKRGGVGRARKTADFALSGNQEEIPLVYPVTTEIPSNDPRYIALIGDFFETAAYQLAGHLEAGRDVAVLCEGDPLFYGSFLHLHVRLAQRFTCRVIPGITSMSGCWANANVPMVWGTDVLTVLPGTLDERDLVTRLKGTDAAVIMKLGSNLPKVCNALAEAGLTSRAIYVELGTTAAERIIPLKELSVASAPYFSLILVPSEASRS